MASVNTVILIGNLGKDPEMRFLPNGEAVANFSIATTETWKTKEGVKQEKTEWHNIVMYRKLAEIAEQYLKKGGSVYIQGKLQTQSWEKDGVKQYKTVIIADSMQMLGGKDSSREYNQSAPSEVSRPPREVIKSTPDFDDFADDIPF